METQPQTETREKSCIRESRSSKSHQRTERIGSGGERSQSSYRPAALRPSPAERSPRCPAAARRGQYRHRCPPSPPPRPRHGGPPPPRPQAAGDDDEEPSQGLVPDPRQRAPGPVTGRQLHRPSSPAAESGAERGSLGRSRASPRSSRTGSPSAAIFSSLRPAREVTRRGRKGRGGGRCWPDMAAVVAAACASQLPARTVASSLENVHSFSFFFFFFHPLTCPKTLCTLKTPPRERVSFCAAPEVEYRYENVVLPV